MDGGDEIRQLLREIRDTQREQLAEYRKVAERSLELQQRAVARQEQIGRFSRRLMVGGGVLIAVLLMLLVYVLARWWPTCSGCSTGRCGESVFGLRSRA